jgi:predicted ATPase/class 3 adenylate cyclase
MEAAGVTAFLFTDIEGSTGLWETQPGRMREALARHDAIVREAVERHGGSVVKTTGDGVHAAFVDPLDAVLAGVALQRALQPGDGDDRLALAVRCGIHAGVVERRDNDYFGPPVNRAARIMSIAYAGQILVSQAVSDLVLGRLPRELALVPLGTVQLRGLSTAEPLHQVVHSALRRDFPPLRALDGAPNNLPQQLTSFIGRAQDLDVLEALVQRARLVTIVGTGGLGKTRLALELAHRALDAFPDGVWFVDLAAIGDASLVPLAVASALSLTEEASRSIEETLVAYARARHLLIVLDNCEHLAHACASLAQALLRGSIRAAIVATSREPLRVTGEAVHALSTLSLPDEAPATLETLMRADAVRLFVDRAVAGNPRFAITPANAAAIATICRRVDGIPLALELAAARMRSLPAAVLASRLDDRFRLLTGGDRTALPRQQTLRALIDWSHDLLDAPERTLFRRLGVFAGNFTLDACEAICAGDGVDVGDVVDILGRLVDKSLVTLLADRSCYRMLETIREYAAARLASCDEAHDVRDRHLHYFVDVAETNSGELTGPEQASALLRLDLQRENFLAAHAWCDTASDGAERGIRLVYALKSYWINRGLLELGYRMATEALGRTGANDALLRCRGLFMAGQIACWTGRYEDARTYLDESLAIARAKGDARRVASALQPLGLACLGLGDVSAAQEHLEEAVVIARAMDERHDLLAALNGVAQVHRAGSNVAAAIPLYEQVLDLARGLGDRESIAIGLLNLTMASIAATGGEPTASVGPMLAEVLLIVDETGSQPVLQSLLEVSSGLAAARGEHAFAAELFGAAQAQAARTGLQRDPSDEAFLAPLIDAARAALGADAFGGAQSNARAPDVLVPMLRGWLASL